jgi:hypothetical protein
VDVLSCSESRFGGEREDCARALPLVRARDTEVRGVELCDWYEVGPGKVRSGADCEADAVELDGIADGGDGGEEGIAAF